MKTLLSLVLFASGLTANANVLPTAGDDVCYQVSAVEGIFAKTSELLCLSRKPHSDDSEYRITLKYLDFGSPEGYRVVAAFDMNLLAAARCMDCNANLFGINNPSNSSFNKLKIKFDGVVDESSPTRVETGTVKIGETLFYYRSVN